MVAMDASNVSIRDLKTNQLAQLEMDSPNISMQFKMLMPLFLVLQFIGPIYHQHIIRLTKEFFMLIIIMIMISHTSLRSQ